MKTKLTFMILMLVCIICISAIPQSTPVQWEYKFEQKCDEKKANQLGAEGWELAGTPDTGITTTFSIYVFKRPKN